MIHSCLVCVVRTSRAIEQVSGVCEFLCAKADEQVEDRLSIVRPQNAVIGLSTLCNRFRRGSCTAVELWPLWPWKCWKLEKREYII